MKYFNAAFLCGLLGFFIGAFIGMIYVVEFASKLRIGY